MSAENPTTGIRTCALLVLTTVAITDHSELCEFRAWAQGQAHAIHWIRFTGSAGHTRAASPGTGRVDGRTGLQRGRPVWHTEVVEVARSANELSTRRGGVTLTVGLGGSGHAPPTTMGGLEGI
jgi:hypothetical protein